MKRETNDWLKAVKRSGNASEEDFAADALASAARLRAEVKQLRALVRDREARLARAELAIGLEFDQRTVRRALAACDLSVPFALPSSPAARRRSRDAPRAQSCG